tara:strand:+ start:694 stop:852 length:159 start_codon:yes stop_codon:yes gene_type:complete
MTMAHDNERNENDKRSAADHSPPFQHCFKHRQAKAAKQDCANVSAQEAFALV